MRSSMKLKTFNSNDMEQNIYLYYGEQSPEGYSEGVIIDTGCSAADKKNLLAAISENNITVKAILLTHGHYDHLIAAEELRTATGAKIYCHESDAPLLENPNLNLSIYRGMNISLTADSTFKDGDTFAFGGCTLNVLHTPGHTPGGVCYHDAENSTLFSGDTLFKNAVGRTDFPYASHDLLMDSIKTKLFVLPNDTVVYPGHDRATTIGAEK